MSNEFDDQSIPVIETEGIFIFKDGKYLHIISIYSNGEGHAPIIDYHGTYPKSIIDED